MLPFADQLFKDADFIFQQDLAPIAKRTKSWLNDHGVGVLDWPANSPDLNPKENLWGIVKRKWAEGHCQRNLGFHTTSVSSATNWSPPRQIEAVIKAKGAPTKYWVHIQYMNILSRRPTIHKKKLYWSYEVF